MYESQRLDRGHSRKARLDGCLGKEKPQEVKECRGGTFTPGGAIPGSFGLLEPEETYAPNTDKQTTPDRETDTNDLERGVALADERVARRGCRRRPRYRLGQGRGHGGYRLCDGRRGAGRRLGRPPLRGRYPVVHVACLGVGGGVWGCLCLLAFRWRSCSSCSSSARAGWLCQCGCDDGVLYRCCSMRAARMECCAARVTSLSCLDGGVDGGDAD